MKKLDKLFFKTLKIFIWFIIRYCQQPITIDIFYFSKQTAFFIESFPEKLEFLRISKLSKELILLIPQIVINY